MKKFNEIYESIIRENYAPFEDYSSSVKKVNHGYEYLNCTNKSLISEDSLSRTLSVIQDKDFAILTAYRGNFSKEENIIRNRQLRAILNQNKMGVHQLVGHWLEAPDGKDYKETAPNELKDVVERSYLVAKPDSMDFESFKSLILSLLTIEGATQDAAILKNSEGIFLLYNNGNTEKIGNTCTLNKIQQAYSQHVKNPTPFVFEGIEMPITNLGKQIFKKHNILY